MTRFRMLRDGSVPPNHQLMIIDEELERHGPIRACFVGSVVYQRPLDSTTAKKFRALESLGEVFVIGFRDGLCPARHRESARFFLLPRLPTPALRYLCLYTVGLVVLLKCIFRDGVTVVVAQSPYEGLVAAVAKRLSGLAGRNMALVVESHGDFEISPFLQYRFTFAGIYGYLIRFVSRVGLRHADALRAISISTRDQLSHWAPGKPIVVFPTWTDIDVFFNAYEPENPPMKDLMLLLFVGVLIPRKAVDRLIDAFARVAPRLPGARLHLVGAPEDRDYALSLEAMVERLDLSSRVTFLPPMHQRDLAREMAGSAAVVLPSVSEGLGRVVFEAMATGTPVVGSRVGGIVELIDDGETGFLVPPGEVEPLAERLEWMLTHPEGAREMGRKARDRARGFFSTELYVAEYRKLLSLALERSSWRRARR